MVFNLSKYSKHFFILFVLFLIKFVKSDDLIGNNINMKSLFIGGKIIYINRSSNNGNIYCYDIESKSTNTLDTYDTNFIKSSKNIKKLNDKKFIIFGLSIQNSYYRFYYQIYSINNNGNLSKNLPNLGESSLGLNINSIDEFDAKVVYKQEKLIISGIINGNFMTISFDISDPNNCLIYQIPQSSQLYYSLDEEDYQKVNIRCNSFNGENFFCSFYYKDKAPISSIYPLYFVTGKFGANNDENNENIINICEKDCPVGNIETIDDNKYSPIPNPQSPIPIFNINLKRVFYY